MKKHRTLALRKKSARAKRRAVHSGGQIMDLRHLKFFIAVYETRGFSTASKLLGTVTTSPF
jgi:hypothetical protein